MDQGADLPYRRCVGIVVFDRRGLVWTGRRKTQPDDELSGAELLWQFPQGGVDCGEDLEQAARRELFEETGISSVEFLAELPEWLYYDLPENLIGVALKGKYRGQKQKWFAYRFCGADSDIQIDPPPAGHEAEFDEWRWRPLPEIPELVVPFKRKIYDRIAEAFADLAVPAG